MLSVVHNYYYLLTLLIIHSLRTSICVCKYLYMVSVTFDDRGGVGPMTHFRGPQQVQGHIPWPWNCINNPQKLLYLSGWYWFQFCSHFCSRTIWIPSQLFSHIFYVILCLNCVFSALAWSVGCFTSFLELFNNLPNSFIANMQLFHDARIALTFLMEYCDCISIYSH